jgi:putative selenium metabolism hydrolase
MSRQEDRAALVRETIAAQAEEIIAFLREIVAIPSYDGDIRAVAAAVAGRMSTLGFDDVRYDAMGNLLGRIGSGPRSILFDSHLDTVGVSDVAAWPWDPFAGKLEDGIVYGLGAGDEKGSTPAMLYGLATLKRHGLAGDWTLWYFGNIEEWCEGSACRALVETEGIVPDYVVVGESTNLDIYLGQRGRAEYQGIVTGRAGHGSAPERAESAIDKALPVLDAIRRMNGRLARHDFLGDGSIAVTRVHAAAGSANVIPDRCEFWIDRRLTIGETAESALAELNALPQARAAGARFTIPRWEQPSYTGYLLSQSLTFPSWLMPDDHPFVRAATRAKDLALGAATKPWRWDFSTNGVYWNGERGIPTIGFGPGDERYAHTVLDQVPAAEVVAAARFYACLPLALETV